MAVIDSDLTEIKPAVRVVDTALRIDTDEGRADAPPAPLEIRGIAVTDARREQVRDCDDESTCLEWLRRAATATSAEEVFADSGA